MQDLRNDVDKQEELVVKFHSEKRLFKSSFEIVSEGRLQWHKVKMSSEVNTEMMISRTGLRTITIHHQSVPLDRAYFVIVYERLNEKLLSYSPECEFGSETRLINNVISAIEENIDEKL